MEENQPVPSLPASTEPAAGGEIKTGQQSKAPITLIIVGAVILVLIIVAAVLLLTADNETTARVRDVFIIFMALESIVIGVALVVLIVQIATLVNLLQNEIRPIINSSSETVNTLRGTVVFISENLAGPVIKLNAFLAAIKQFFELMRPGSMRH